MFLEKSRDVIYLKWSIFLVLFFNFVLRCKQNINEKLSSNLLIGKYKNVNNNKMRSEKMYTYINKRCDKSQIVFTTQVVEIVTILSTSVLSHIFYNTRTTRDDKFFTNVFYVILKL